MSLDARDKLTPPEPVHKMGEEALSDWIEYLQSLMRPRWVQVAMAVNSGKSGREAYWAAYGEGDMPADKADQTDANASRLIASARVKALLEALRQRSARAEGIDLPTLVRAQLDIARRARAAEDFGNERQAMAEVAKLLDLYPTEKKELFLKGEGLSDLTPEQWEAVIESAQGDTPTLQ